MASILILGAGPAGLFSALCLARRGYDVTVVDGNAVSAESNRSAVGHARQGHTFLALGTNLLHREAPDVVDLLIEAGAHRAPLAHDARYWNLLMRRALLDGSLRRVVSKYPYVRLLAGVKATGLLIKSCEMGPPQVVGIRTAEEALEANIVIDAGGWASPVYHWLWRAGVQLAAVNHPRQFIYISRPYRLRAGIAFPTVRVPILVHLDYATAIAFPEDNDHFQLTVQVDHTDPFWRTLKTPWVFEQFLAEIPKIAPWLGAGTATGDPEVFACIGNSRKFTFFDRHLVIGLLLVGDAAAHTNPTAGRGVSLALAHARALADLLAEDAHASDLFHLNEKWDRITSALIGPWFDSQVTIDRESEIRFRASIQGQVSVPGKGSSSAFARALADLSDCKIVGAAGDRLLNLLSTPQQVFGDRDVMRRVLRHVSSFAGDETESGPSRQRFELLMSG